ncbi:flagellar hook-associated protein FlgK [Plastorhodobacter daqingensis]|uniref:Flagellar hook-associated protein 1 n=1 Tax=Plastorhodobacter daqingensis TaxID=1387281 RepID=A0ABW2UGG8_9RHOB
MSITTSLSNAMSGLNAASRAAEVVSSNIANAMTEGYARRELMLSSRDASGVQIDGIQRILNQAILTDRRVAVAASGEASVTLAFLRKTEAQIGTPDDASSLSARIAALEATLLEASARPESDARLANVLSAAKDVAQHFHAISTDVQIARGDADRSIATDVKTLNESLVMIADLNRQIATTGLGGRDVSALLDQRQQLVDKISSIVPVKEVARDNGQIALITSGGALLLDGRPAQIEFAAAGLITADMTLASGALSGVTINGFPAARSLEGGSLSAHFAVRDDLAVDVQVQLDALARNLLERLSDPSVDPSLGAGAPGLFTDQGGPFDPADEVGLAARLRLNGAVDPAQGGALWRLRDGIGAAAPGDVGNGTILGALGAALAATGPAASGGFGSTAKSFSGLAAEMLSLIAAERQTSETRSSFAAARVGTLRLAELQGGVDTDEELQRLLLIEQAYAANARVIQAADEMMQALLRL